MQSVKWTWKKHIPIHPLLAGSQDGGTITCWLSFQHPMSNGIVFSSGVEAQMSPEPITRKTNASASSNLLILALLCAIFAQATGSAAQTSITIDEGLHITSGYTILRTGNFRLVEEHPPLVKLLEALPLLLVPDLPDPTTLPGWESDVAVTDSVRLVRATQSLIYPYQPVDRLVFAARVPVALLAVFLGAVVFRWAADLWGWKGGLLALFLLAFDPNILAHAAVAGTDLGATCFITLALFCLTRFLRHPTMPRLVLAGVTLGLAQGAKLSALILLPVVALLVVLALPRRRIFSLLLLLLVAGLVFWGIYGFELGSVPGVPFPVPAASHYIPWQRLNEHMADGHSAFLMGDNRSQGWLYYFPVAFGLKTPLPTLLLLLAAAVAFWKGTRRSLLEESSLLLFPLAYGASSLLSPLNIGYRHLLPILPLLFIFISRITLDVSRLTLDVSRLTLYVLLFWLSLSTLRIAPHYLAYFNELAGGPDGGWRYLADSNTDWGQAYKHLARFQQEQGVGPVRLSAFIFYDPAIYGVEYEPLTPMRGDTPAVFPSRFNPPPGDYVISATTLDGIPMVDPEMYDWFRKHEPDALIGHVLFYYQVPPPDPIPGWLAQCTVPVPPLSPQVAAEGFGRDIDGLRLAYFDCTQAWLYPDGGQSPGWYAFYRGEETEVDFTREHRAPAHTIYEQRIPRGVPSFAIDEWSHRTSGWPIDGVQDGPVTIAPSTWSPRRAEMDGVALPPPFSLAGSLMFLGYRLEADAVEPGKALYLWTYWSVIDIPDYPLSLMAHLLDEAGEPAAVGDGLGVPVESWQVGDAIVQRHTLEIPPGATSGTYWLQTGAYALADLQRLAVTPDGQPVGDRIVLAQLEVGSR